MKKILLTGITGFVGSHLSEELIKQKYEVHAVIRENSNLDDLPLKVKNKVLCHRLKNGMDINKIMKSVKPDVVVHLASLFLAQHSGDDIDNLIESNITFGTKILEAMSQNKVRLFLNTGTAWQYYMDEKYNPVNLYAASKQAFEAMLTYYQKIGAVDAITLILTDTYGPGDKRKKLLALLDDIAESGKELLMSPGEQKIDLVHINDVINAYLLAIKYLLNNKKEYFKSYKISSENAISLRELAMRYSRLKGKVLNIRWGGRPYRLREVMVPWSNGEILPGWERIHKELM